MSMSDVEEWKEFAESPTANAPANPEGEEDWTAGCVADARQDIPLMTDAASETVTKLLKGLLSERALTPAELKTLATQLIDDMVPPVSPPAADAGDAA